MSKKMILQLILKKISRIRKMIRKLRMEILTLKLCKEEGLTEAEIDKITAVIECESGFDDKVTNENNDKENLCLKYGYCKNSIDYGICQFNDFWYYHYNNNYTIHPDVALNNPEEAVKVMIRQYKRGQLKDWVCYKRGLYKKYLSKGEDK